MRGGAARGRRRRGGRSSAGAAPQRQVGEVAVVGVLLEDDDLPRAELVVMRSATSVLPEAHPPAMPISTRRCAPGSLAFPRHQASALRSRRPTARSPLARLADPLLDRLDQLRVGRVGDRLGVDVDHRAHAARGRDPLFVGAIELRSRYASSTPRLAAPPAAARSARAAPPVGRAGRGAGPGRAAARPSRERARGSSRTRAAPSPRARRARARRSRRPRRSSGPG